jgi:hypothetical protein
LSHVHSEVGTSVGDFDKSVKEHPLIPMGTLTPTGP